MRKVYPFPTQMPVKFKDLTEQEHNNLQDKSFKMMASHRFWLTDPR